MNNKGQSLIMFALSIAALMAILISVLLLSISSLEKEVDVVRVKVNSYQATIQIAQIVQSAWDLGRKDATCATFTGTERVTVSGRVLCLPASNPCFSYRYCMEKSPTYSITSLESMPHLDIEPEPQKSFALGISLWPQAQAQAAATVLQPALSSVPTSNVVAPTCPDASQRCVLCQPTAGYNADCFRVKICTNGSSSCPNQENYYEAPIAIVHRK